jgi:4-hydroxy-3-methylbut-2-enyl diphosphate reductase
MKVILAKKLGFCFGVKRALEMTEKALAEGGKIAILGHLIHNQAVTHRLESRGLKRVSSLDEVETGSFLILGAHGITRELYQDIERRGIHAIDTTCMFVKKAQDAAALLGREGYSVFLVGDRNHTEVKGIVSAAGVPVTILLNDEDIREVGRGRKAGILFQTTQSAERCRFFWNAVIERFDEIRVFNTICMATSERQEAVRELAASVDAMIIVGDPKSANTKRLAAISREINPRSFMVENADQLDVADFQGLETVGMTAGASTPDWLISEVRQRLETF